MTSDSPNSLPHAVVGPMLVILAVVLAWFTGMPVAAAEPTTTAVSAIESRSTEARAVPPNSAASFDEHPQFQVDQFQVDPLRVDHQAARVDASVQVDSSLNDTSAASESSSPADDGDREDEDEDDQSGTSLYEDLLEKDVVPQNYRALFAEPVPQRLRRICPSSTPASALPRGIEYPPEQG